MVRLARYLFLLLQVLVCKFQEELRILLVYF